MKKTYFYSDKQRLVCLETLPNYKLGIAPNGKLYTKVETSEGEHKSGFDDAEIVCVTEGYTLDELTFELKRISSSLEEAGKALVELKKKTETPILSLFN